MPRSDFGRELFRAMWTNVISPETWRKKHHAILVCCTRLWQAGLWRGASVAFGELALFYVIQARKSLF